MKELLILTGKIGPKRKALAKYVSQSLSGQAKVTLGLFADLIFEIDGKKINVKLSRKKITDFDLVVFKGVGRNFLIRAGDLALCLEHLGVDYTDTAFRQIGPFGSKMTSLIKLSLAGLPMMPSFCCQKTKIKGLKDEIISKFGLPLIVKELSLQGGKGVFLLKNKQDFSFLDKVEPEKRFLFQSYFPNSNEYRILVLDYQPLVYYQKIITNPNEFRANTALGAEERYYHPNQAPKRMKEMAVKAARALGYEIAGVDFLVEKKTGKIWILEVNRGPGFTYDIRISPELPALVSFLAKKMGVKQCMQK